MEVKIKLNLKPVPAGVFGLGLVFFFFQLSKKNEKFVKFLENLYLVM